MDIIDLDKNTSCILCSLDYQYLDKLILTHFTRLAPKLTKEALYSTLHQFIESNKKRLEMQGISVPNITADDLQNHYEYHQVSLVRALIAEIRQIQQLQEDILNGKSDEKQIAIYLRLSNHRITLIKKLEGLETPHLKIEPYKYD